MWSMTRRLSLPNRRTVYRLNEQLSIILSIWSLDVNTNSLIGGTLWTIFGFTNMASLTLERHSMTRTLRARYITG
jgi:hypothetical protein